MLELVVYDDGKKVVLQFEHSLLSLSKWESKHKKAFLTTQEKLHTEMIDYFQDMLVSPEGCQNLVYALTPEQHDELTNYINDIPSASGGNLPKQNSRGFHEVMTSEMIYYAMVALQINWEAQTWHLNRLMMLIRIIEFKQTPQKKRNPVEVMNDWYAESQRRKKLYGISG